MRILISCLLLLSFAGVVAQPEPGYRLFTTDVGLPTNEIFASFQDSKGYMWFATDMGVSRFDGFEFENFDTQSGLSDNTTLSIFEGNDGKIWFLPISGRMSYYRRGKIHPFKFNERVISNMRKGSLFVSGYIDQPGNIYLTGNLPPLVVSNEGKVTHPGMPKTSAVYLPASKTWLTSRSLPHRPVGKAAEFLVERDGKIIAKAAYTPTQPSGASTFRAAEDADHIYVSSCNICCKMRKDGSEQEFYKTPRAILYVYRDSQNGLWLVLSQGGVYYFKNADLKQKPAHYLRNYAVSSVYEDRNGSFWITTEKGVLQIPSINYQTLTTSNGLSSDNITCLAGNGKEVFAGTYDGGVERISSNGEHISAVIKSGPFKRSLYKLFCKNDTLWFSGRGIAGNIRKNKLTLRKDLEFGRDIVPFGSDLALGTFGKIFFIHPKKTTAFASPYRINALLSFHGDLLAGTISGLWIFRTDQHTWEHLNHIHPLLNNALTDLEQSGGQIICATKGFGLFLLDSALKTCRQLSSKDGLSSDNVKGLYVDGAMLWLATDKGLNQLALPVLEKSRPSLILTTEDGLISNRINGVVRCENKLWVATDKGITIIGNPEKKRHPYIPFFLTGAEINGEWVDLGRLRTLSHRQNNITIHFKSLPVDGNTNVRYLYRIKGLDNNWNSTSLQQVQYANLSPGEYEFQVGIADANRVRGIRSVFINISTPIWLTWWFILVTSAGVGIGITLILRQRALTSARRQFQQQLLNQQITQLELKALRLQMNPHFIFNCINSIQRFILNNEKHEAYTYMVKFSRLMRLILESSSQDFVPLQNELDTIKLYLELEQLRFKDKFRYAINRSPELPNDLQIPAMLIQPYVENALWHGLIRKEEDSFLTVDIVQKGDFLIIIVEDNGIGRDAAKRSASHDESHKSHGMKITHERLTAFSTKYNLNFTVNIVDLYNNAVPAGTRVEISLPIFACTIQTPPLYVTQNPDH